ncbi:hypothetical protein C8J57DRAFT_1235224 [Mycena rebaudengoi]|nr:hypothetical protein C8J57DRAFT_1235224 [Mycena rebaudengoi]
MAGTAMMGSDTNSYSTLYRSPQTPSSSPETYSFLRSSPARSVGPAPNLVDRTVETPAPSKHGGLRTPTDSGDLKLDSKLQAAAAKAFSISPVISATSAGTAPCIQTFTGADALPQEEVRRRHIRQHADIRVRGAGGIVRTRVPDFAFAKMTNGANPRPEYGIVFESSYSERSTHVKDKTTNWFSVPSILGAVVLKFEVGTLSSSATTHRAQALFPTPLKTLRRAPANLEDPSDQLFQEDLLGLRAWIGFEGVRIVPWNMVNTLYDLELKES